MDQAVSTIVVPIEGELAPLRAQLRRIQRDIGQRRTHAVDGALLPFADLRTLHFARFVVLDPPLSAAGKPVGQPLLIFATVHDGAHAPHLNELVTVAGEGLLRVFALCDKELAGQPRDSLRSYLERYRVDYAAFWGGHPGRAVAQIHAEADLHDRISGVLGHSSRRLSSDPFAEVSVWLREQDELRWVLSPPAATRVPGYRKVLQWGALVLAAIPLIPAAFAWLPWLRVLELREARNARAQRQEDRVAERDAERAHKGTLLEDEDHHIQNQLSAISEVKSGFMRLLTLRVVLWVVHRIGRALWDKGALNGIRSIHFARWFLVEQGGRHRLVFLSNYDGSWEHYLGEFIHHSEIGLTAIWSNVVGFPDAKWLVGAGARRELKFKRWARTQQIETQVWYSAYPDLSVANVQNNSEIRRGLLAVHGLDERRAWLRRI